MLFQEIQYLRHPVLYIILVVAWVFCIAIMLAQPTPWYVYVLLSGLFILINTFFYMLRLTITVEPDRISLSMFPFFGTRVMQFTDIKSITVNALNPVFDYGGWGYRIVPFQNTTAYIMQGEAVVVIVLKNSGKKVAASLKDPERFKAALSITTFDKDVPVEHQAE